MKKTLFFQSILFLAVSLLNGAASSREKLIMIRPGAEKSVADIEIKEFQKRAQSGDVSAMEKIEELYLGNLQSDLPILVKPGSARPATNSEINALKSKPDDVSALVKLSYIYIGEKHSIPEAIPYLKKAANKGNEAALITLARIYRHQKNPEEEASWLKKAATFGHKWAMNQLLFNMISDKAALPPLLETTTSTQKIQDLKRLAKRGDVAALEALGSKYLNEKNVNQATGWFRKAAAKGSELGLLYLAHLYRDNKNWIKEQQVLEQAVKAGYDWALKPLIVLQLNTFPEYAAEWLDVSAKKGDAPSALLLKKIKDNQDMHFPLGRAIDWYFLSGWRNGTKLPY